MKKPFSPLILLPGRGCNDLLWQKILPWFPQSMLPVMPDLFACTSMDDMIDVIAKQPYEKMALLGFSMGGHIAQAFYAKYPERVSHLILICASNTAYIPNAEEQAERLAIIDAYEQNPSLVTSGKYLARFIQPGLENTDSATQISIAMIKAVGVPTICRQMRATLVRHSYTDTLEQCTIPSLVIGARFDKVVSPASTENLAKALHVQPQWVDCGHMAPLEAPDEVGRILRNWFENNVLT